MRLTDADLDLIVAALRSRGAMTKGLRRHRIERLAERLSEMAPGNPMLRFDEFGQTHEDRLGVEDCAEAEA